MPSVTIGVEEAAVPIPRQYRLTGIGELELLTATAVYFDVSGASPVWRPALAVYAPDGTLISRVFAINAQAAGGDVYVTFGRNIDEAYASGLQEVGMVPLPKLVLPEDYIVSFEATDLTGDPLTAGITVARTELFGMVAGAEGVDTLGALGPFMFVPGPNPVFV
jgi:hypothetical protein